jgi:hypothetical protein
LKYTHKQVSPTVALVIEKATKKAVATVKFMDGMWTLKTDSIPFGVVSSGWCAGRTLDDLCRNLEVYEDERARHFV